MRRFVPLSLRNANLLSRPRNLIYPSFIKSSFLVETADMSSETESKRDKRIDRRKFDGGATSLKEAKEKYEFFWKKYSPFSQHHESHFKVEDIEFNCAEQYMMYKKAMLFEDKETAEEILRTKSPSEQKSLGRQVKKFDDELWKKNCQRIVEEANEAKFGQNLHLKKILFATYPKILVEASPVDRIWGIGLAEDDDRAWDERSWRGTNYLGKCLSNVRKRLMGREGLLKDDGSMAEAAMAVEKDGLLKEAAMAIDRSSFQGGATSLQEAKEKYEFFWKKHSPFSQHHESSFKVEDKEFNCAEQYMMYKKALLFGDTENAENILSTKSPQKQKSFGRKVENFDDEIWKKNCRRIVEEANEAKFGQNKHLKKILFATHPKILVEASPVDSIWGIGLTEDNVDAWDERSWKGTNYLGYCLTNVRKRLMEQEGRLKETDSNPTEAAAVKNGILRDKESKVAAVMAIDRSACDGGATSLEEAKMKYEFFWKKVSPFCQDHEVYFKVDDKEFNCANQYMMYKKAMLFGDEESAEKILSKKNPRKQRDLGQKVKNFNEEIWNKNCQRIAEEGNEAKFRQNKHLMEILFSTHPKILVEANPVDSFWGIGLAEDNVNAWDEQSWKGTNYLGHCLTNVRKRLMEQEGLLTETESNPTETTAVEKEGLLRDNKSNAAAAISNCNGGATSLEEAKEKYEFFWTKDSPFSQHHKSSFKVKDKEFNCAEQYMMYKKAMLFGDKETAEKILRKTSPPKQKDLGRKVKNFKDEVWKQNCQRIVEEANEAKFGQNEDLKEILFATHPKILVEASPGDCIWGIGLAEDDVKAWDERSWKGTNYLGYCLTNVRDRLMEQEGLLKETESNPTETMTVEKEGHLKDIKSNAAAMAVDISNCNGGATS